MGIVYFEHLRHKYAPKCSYISKISSLPLPPGHRNKGGIHIAIDLSILMYYFKGLNTEDGLNTLVKHFTKFENNARIAGIITYYVADGRSSTDKSDEYIRRQEERTKNLDEIKALETKLSDSSTSEENIIVLNKLRELKHRTMVVSTEERHKVFEVLEELSANIIVASHEADPLLAALVKYDYVDYVMSEDTDMYAYGCSYILHRVNKFPIIEKDKEPDLFNEDFEVIDLSKMLKEFDLTQTQLTQVCVLAGCDYYRPTLKIKLDRYFIRNAYFAIKNHGSVEYATNKTELNGKYGYKHKHLQFILAYNKFIVSEKLSDYVQKAPPSLIMAC